MLKNRQEVYKTAKWQEVRHIIITRQRGICNRCSNAIDIVHHKTYLNDNNYNDYSIAYGLNNLEGLCIDCHNKEHFEKESKSKRKELEFDDKGNLVKSPPLKNK